MANHIVTIHKHGADPSRVPVVSGDTVTFTAEANAPSILCMSPQTAGIFSSFNLPAGASLTVTLGAVPNGNYCVVVQASGWPCPTELDCPAGGSEAVLLIRGADGSFPGPGDTTGGGGGA